MTLENLTQLQKVAIEGEVAKAYASAKHNSEILYRFYTMLKNAPQDITSYIVEVTNNLVGIDEETLTRTALETLADEPPVWLWIDKTVEDIKLSIKLALAEGVVCDTDTDKKLIQEKIIRSAFITFARKAALTCTKATRELCNRVIEETKELGFLEDVCFALLGEISELPETLTMTDSLFHSEFDIRNMLSYRIEKEIMDKRNNRDSEERTIQKQAKDINDKIDKVIEEALIVPVGEEHNDVADATVYAVKMAVDDEGFMADAVNRVMKKILDDQLKTDKAMKAKETKYAVVKEYENSVSTTLKAFDTEAEAESYKEKIESNFPELMKSCTLKVKKIK